MAYVIEAEGLVKEYRMGLLPWRARIVRALDGVDLRVARGTLFSLLGPNGAGKTTLVKILSTLLIPDRGWARVSGFDVVEEAGEVRRRIGVVLGGERALYWRLSGWDNLWFFSQLYGIPPREARRRVRELLELVGLEEWAHVRVENYSKGMKQRLHIARGLINDPEVLLLDEPTIGLDPRPPGR
ncbi:ABC transporter ATP-binding protein [Aeropyrum camini]|uniref:ABC transporter ATP-binding protein n=1 Tax=Aeropyrum camini TaxID=229980 RepID=UPI001C4325AB|nr:ABC transporter ATP-binding protein [Aeropyrum camini]